MTSVIALTLACLIPLTFLYLMRGVDFYKTGNFRSVLLSVAWGLAAYELAVLVNTALIDGGIVSRDQLIRFAAPVVEEILKGIIIFYLVSRTDFRYFVDGAIYGFSAGIGFAIVENFEYVLGHPEAALMIAVSRVFSTNLIHAAGSAILGVALGRSRFDHSASFRRWGALAAGLLLSIGLHTGFNNMASNGMLLIYAIASGAGAAAFIWYAIRQGLKEEKRWIEEKLPEFDRITFGEAAIVNRFERVKKVLAPVAQHFGDQTASLCEEFLRKQAHLGILRKSAEKFKDNEPMRLANEDDIVRTAAEMEKLRKQVGDYAMLYLRTIFPEDGSPVWGLIDERVTAAGAGPAGGGVWTNLDARVKIKQQEHPE